jgi:DNA polymerase
VNADETTTDPREELRRLVRRARMLVQAEREGGIVDLPGTRPPAVADVPSAPETAALPSPPPRAATPPSRPAPVPAEPEFQPRVRSLDLPADALAPFGDLPATVAECRRCGLCEHRTRTVFGEGSPSARLVFCGEGPGYEEDRTGRPFVGRAGELLTAMIEKGLKMRREDVFILNAVKCRPPENRTPTPDEIAACRPFLERQFTTIRPTVIVALGNPACRALLGDVPGIMTIRGKVFEAFGARVVPTFHPAYLLRNPDAKRETWTDLQLVMRLLADPTATA